MTKTKLGISSAILKLIILCSFSCTSFNDDIDHRSEKPRESISGILGLKKSEENSPDTSVSFKREEGTIKTSSQKPVPDYNYPLKPSKKNWTEDIGEVFLMLPDTIFQYEGVNGHDFNSMTLSLKEELIQHKNVLFENIDCQIELSKKCVDNQYNCLDRDEDQMSIGLGYRNDNGTGCALDNVSKFQLNRWMKDDGPLFTIVLGSAFFDFEESQLFILEPLPGGWKDVTNEFVGLNLSDFIDESYFKQENIERIEEKELQEKIDSPPLYISENPGYSEGTIRLMLHEYILYLEFEFYDQGKQKSITDYIKYDYVDLIWNGEIFEKEFGKLSE